MKTQAVCGCTLNAAGNPCHGPRCHLFKGPEAGGDWHRITMTTHRDGSHSMKVERIPPIEEHEPLFTAEQWRRIRAVAQTRGEDPIAWVRGVIGLSVQSEETGGYHEKAKPWDVTET